MKNLKILVFFVLIWIVISCQKSKSSFQPEILTATYEIKTQSEFEKGYELCLHINQVPEDFEIKGVILENKLFEKIISNRIGQNQIEIEQFLPIESRLIQNFEAPKTDNRSDGIIFVSDSRVYFYKVTFKLK